MGHHCTGLCGRRIVAATYMSFYFYFLETFKNVKTILYSAQKGVKNVMVGFDCRALDITLFQN